MMIKFEDKQDKTLHFIFAHSLQMYKDNEKKKSYKDRTNFPILGAFSSLSTVYGMWKVVLPTKQSC